MQTAQQINTNISSNTNIGTGIISNNQPNSPDTWRITSEERVKHNASFMQLNPVNGFLGGPQARDFFLKSGLSTAILHQIWNLADINKDGQLDQAEFSIACYLIKKVLQNPQSILPTALPKSLLQHDGTSTINTTHTVANPTFNATFPVIPSVTAPLNASKMMMPTTTSGTGVIYPNTTTTTVAAMIPGAVPTPLVNAVSTSSALVPSNLPNPLSSIPASSRSKFTQIFQSNMDPQQPGFMSGAQARILLLNVGLQQATLSRIWQLADQDQDGRLSLEEFCIAMHLCDYCKQQQNSGALPHLPQHLPLELQPTQLIQSKTPSTPPGGSIPTSISNGDLTKQLQASPETTVKQQQPQSTGPKSFEEKLKENLDRGNAVLEAQRQKLREQEQREKRERDEKERAEQERKQKLRDEQERRRMQEIERQMERQRLLDQQREEERRKLFEQREAARMELARQQRLEWERAKTAELETQKSRLQEQLSTLRAKDKNLEYDMQVLDEKIQTYRQKCNDTQQQVQALTAKLESTRTAYILKQSECELKERHVGEYTRQMQAMQHARLRLAEQQQNLNQDNPFAEQYRTEQATLKQKQMQLSHQRQQLDQMEQQLNAQRTQFECMKHELELQRADVNEFGRENGRIEQLLHVKQGGDPSTFKRDNYDTLKEELSKANLTKEEEPASAVVDEVNWSSNDFTADPFANDTTNNKSNEEEEDPFSSSNNYNNNNKSKKDDPFASAFVNSSDFDTTASPTINKPTFDPFGAPFTNGQTAADDDFGQNAFDNNWAADFSKTTNSSDHVIAATVINQNNNDAFVASTTNTNSIATNNNSWAAFDDASKSVDNNSNKGQFIKYKAMFQFDATREDELSLRDGDVINVNPLVRTDDGWLWGECMGRRGVFPADFATRVNDLGLIQEEAASNSFFHNSTNSGQFSVSPSIESIQKKLSLTNRNYYIAIYPYSSGETGDLEFNEFEIINIVDQNEDWLTGEIVNAQGQVSRQGIFPSTFVIKFTLPIEYVGKYTICMATETYAAQNTGELSLDTVSQIIAIKKLAPDGKWAFGETLDAHNQLKRGWYPIHLATTLIDSGATPIYSPNNSVNIIIILI